MDFILLAEVCLAASALTVSYASVSRSPEVIPVRIRVSKK